MIETVVVLGLGLCAVPLAFIEYVNLRVKKAENMAGKTEETDVNWTNPA